MKNNVTLLYVEDDSVARKHYANAFSILFKNVYQAEDATRAYDLYEKYKPDILLVDINLPDGDGLELIKTLRSKNSTSLIIVLSAYSQREQLFKAIELGLFKYLIKPIKNKELLTVLNCAIEEVQLTLGRINKIQISENLCWNKESSSLEYEREMILLSVQENKLIELLLSNTKRIFTLDEIAYFVWDKDKIPSTQAIKNMFNRLRKKIPIEFIKNHYGAGYQINTY